MCYSHQRDVAYESCTKCNSVIGENWGILGWGQHEVSGSTEHKFLCNKASKAKESDASHPPAGIWQNVVPIHDTDMARS